LASLRGASTWVVSFDGCATTCGDSELPQATTISTISKGGDGSHAKEILRPETEDSLKLTSRPTEGEKTDVLQELVMYNALCGHWATDGASLVLGLWPGIVRLMSVINGANFRGTCPPAEILNWHDIISLSFDRSAERPTL
jgi:hypothetical protein